MDFDRYLKHIQSQPAGNHATSERKREIKLELKSKSITFEDDENQHAVEQAPVAQN